MESQSLFRDTGVHLHSIMDGRTWYYKGSFDKANRTSLNSARGPGLKDGVMWAKELKREIPSIKLITDVHSVGQVEKLSDVFDAIQIPAFLCRQTDLLIEAGKFFSLVNIKKGQWASPKQMQNAADKVRSKNTNAKVWITERGTFFGYDTLVVDFAAVPILSESFDKVILDCTHATQRHYGTHTGGDSELAKRYAVSAPIFGYDGIFAELHPDPTKALSDAESQIALSDWETVLQKHDSVKTTVLCYTVRKN